MPTAEVPQATPEEPVDRRTEVAEEQGIYNGFMSDVAAAGHWPVQAESSQSGPAQTGGIRQKTRAHNRGIARRLPSDSDLDPEMQGPIDWPPEHQVDVNHRGAAAARLILRPLQGEKVYADSDGDARLTAARIRAADERRERAKNKRANS